MLTIGDLIKIIEDSVFYYQIITDKLVDSYVTCDALQRHHLEDFIGFQAQGYQVECQGVQQFLTLSLTSHDYTCDGDYLDLPATSDNIREAFVDHPGLISFDGRIIIVKSFKDSIYVDDEWIDDVEFRFTKVSDSHLLQYIV